MTIESQDADIDAISSAPITTAPDTEGELAQHEAVKIPMQPNTYCRVEIPNYNRLLPPPSTRSTAPTTEPFAPPRQKQSKIMVTTHPRHNELMNPTPSTATRTCPSAPFLDFATALVLGAQNGAKFQLADGSVMTSSIPETGREITAYMVREGLERVAAGPMPGRNLESQVQIQQYLVLWAALLNVQAELTGVPVNGHLQESMSACAEFEDTIYDRYNS